MMCLRNQMILSRGKLFFWSVQNLTYGPGCIYQCDQCVHSNTCDPMTGRCQCLPGYTGDFCQKPCDKGFYGDKCQQTCK